MEIEVVSVDEETGKVVLELDEEARAWLIQVGFNKIVRDAIEDKAIAAVDKDYAAMYNFIQYIANDYFELSHEKVRIQRDDYVRMARDLVKKINEYE